MADLDHSSEDTTGDSRGMYTVSHHLLPLKSHLEDNSQDSELEFSEDEETLVIRMFNLVGERWSLIAGRIPGRSAEEIEKYWNSRYSTSE